MLTPRHKPDDYEIELANGSYLDLSNPRTQSITLGAVAHGLANTCRYSGQVLRFYSVAEHAVLVADRLKATGASWVVILLGLHHDDAEAFIGDVTRPLKMLLPEYRTIEARMNAAITLALKLPMSNSDEVDARIKEADDWALAAEAHHLLPSAGRGWWSEGLYAPQDAPLKEVYGQPPEAAEREYVECHLHLMRLVYGEGGK